MNWLDLVVLVIIASSVFIGLKIGIIKAFLSLAGLVIGTFLAGLYYLPLSERLVFIPQPALAKGVAFGIILIGVMIIVSIVSALLTSVVSAVMLGWVNRLGGAIFGLVLGAIFCSALLAIWVKFFGADIISKSTLAAILLDRFPMILALLPDEFDTIRSFFQ